MAQEVGCIEIPNVGVVAKQNSQLSTYIPSADGGGRKDERASEVCTQKELARMAGLKGEG